MAPCSSGSPNPYMKRRCDRRKGSCSVLEEVARGSLEAGAMMIAAGRGDTICGRLEATHKREAVGSCKRGANEHGVHGNQM